MGRHGEKRGRACKRLMMKRFEFRLDKVLEHKRRLEDMDKQELADAQRSLAKSREKLQGLKNHQGEKLEEMSEITPDNIYFKCMYDNYLLRLLLHIENAKDDVNKRGEEVVVKRDELIDSSKKRRVMEKLKERKLEEYAYQRRRWEQGIIDECAKTGDIRKRKEME